MFKQIKNLEGMTLEAYSSRVAPNFRLEVQYEHSETKPGWCGRMGRDLNSVTCGVNVSRRDQITVKMVRKIVADIVECLTERHEFKDLKITSVEIRASSLIAWTYPSTKGDT